VDRKCRPDIQAKYERASLASDESGVVRATMTATDDEKATIMAMNDDDSATYSGDEGRDDVRDKDAEISRLTILYLFWRTALAAPPHDNTGHIRAFERLPFWKAQ
jgi:hypothetical protein